MLLEQENSTLKSQLDNTSRILRNTADERNGYRNDLSIRDQYFFEIPPILIFKNTDVSWKDLYLYLPKELDHAPTLPNRVISSFITPDTPTKTDMSALSWNNETIHFPKPGSYYLYTSLGTFKILVLNPQTSPDEQILSISTFVAGNIVHSNANQPHLGRKIRQSIPSLTGRLFLSDQPLLLWCGSGSWVLNYVLNRMEYKTRFVEVAGPNGEGHQFSEAYFPLAKKWGLIDQDFGAIFRDRKTGTILDTAETSLALAHAPETVEPVFLLQKKKLFPAFNQAPFQPMFSWTPDKMSESPMSSGESYKDLMKHLLAGSVNIIKKPAP